VDGIGLLNETVEAGAALNRALEIAEEIAKNVSRVGEA
jgi:enoyl-CoA hydratase/carnithine racemase